MKFFKTAAASAACMMLAVSPVAASANSFKGPLVSAESRASVLVEKEEGLVGAPFAILLVVGIIAAAVAVATAAGGGDVSN